MLVGVVLGLLQGEGRLAVGEDMRACWGSGDRTGMRRGVPMWPVFDEDGLGGSSHAWGSRRGPPQCLLG